MSNASADGTEVEGTINPHPKKYRPRKKTVPSLKSMVRLRTSLVEGIRLALANVLLELSNVPNLQILSKLNLTGLKPITPTAMVIPAQYMKFEKYVTGYNESKSPQR